jgi:uncharacterized heparinase superfamily protein
MLERFVKSSLEPPKIWARRGANALRERFYATGLYEYLLRGRHPVALAVAPEDPRQGSVDTGNELFRGNYRFAGETISAPNEAPWAVAGGSPEWLREAHGFAWLRHFEACGGEAAGRQVRLYVKDWLTRFDHWHPVAWEPAVTGRRIIAWTAASPTILGGGDTVFRSLVLNSLARQARHLARSASEAPPGPPRMAAAIGLAIAGLSLPDGDKHLAKGMSLVEDELARQVLVDGGVITRNPSDLVSLLEDLVMLRDALTRAQAEVSLKLFNAIDRVAPMIRFFRHGDGKLALFNGSFEEGLEEIAGILARAEAPGKPVANAVHSGFQRLKSGRALVLMDTGAPKSREAGTPHAGMLSFEMSFGKDRLVVNCGASESRSGELFDLARSTAAHSTLVINNTNSMDLNPAGLIPPPPPMVKMDRHEERGHVWIDAWHDGYRAPYGLIHRRRLYLGSGGGDLRGEDLLTVTGKPLTAPLPFDVRFHLHPEVDVSILGDGQAALLRLPRGAGWTFKVRGGALKLDESLYLGRRGEVRRSEQMVVSGATDGTKAAVNWSFTRIGGPGQATDKPEGEG